MAYIVIEDFKSGLDRRKMAAASPPGSLQTLTNAHITRGGEIEKRKAFVPKYALPAGQTYGFAGANGALYVFASASVTVPSGVTCQVLAHPTGAGTLAGVNASEFFDGKVFASARFSDNSNYCFYNGARVTDWDPGAGQTVSGKKATAILTVKSKVYATFGSVLNFSAIQAPTDWGSGTGSGDGFINMSNQSAGSEVLTGIGRYQNYMAVFGRRNTQIWYLDPDPLQNVQRQVIPEIGTFAPKSIVNFGDIDIVFLSDTGVRSLRARDASNQAGVSDIGTPVDDEIIQYVRTLTDAERAAAAAVLDPVDGRYIVAIGRRAYAFSYYPSSRISSWSRYELPGQVDNWVSMDGKLYARTGDTIYLYGGDDGQTYDSSEVVVELPYIDGRSIATWKTFTGFDLISEGEWTVYVNTDPNMPEVWSKIATLQANRVSTLSQLDLEMVGEATMIKLKLVSSRAGPAKISKLVIHYRSDGSH